MSDGLARPTFAPFEVDAVYTWIECPLKKYEGFMVEVRMNLTNRERKRLNDLLTENDEKSARIAENGKAQAESIQQRKNATTDPEETAALMAEQFAFIDEVAAAIDDLNASIHTAVAPYIRNWNLAIHDNGALTNISPPAEIGVEAFVDLDQTLIRWIVTVLLDAYKGGKGWSGSLLTRDEPVAPSPASSETTPNGKPKGKRPASSRPYRAKSLTAVPSTSTA